MVKKISFFTFFFFLLTQMFGCAAPLDVTYGSRDLGSEHTFKKNYEINKKLVANVGEKIIKLQDFWVKTTELPVAIPNITTRVTFGPCSHTLEKGVGYPIMGETTVEDKRYMVVRSGPCAPMYVDMNGEITGQSHGGLYTHKPLDSMVRLTRQKESKLDAKGGYENYEILYNGINEAGLSLTYREFSPDGLARTAFYQNLSYPKNAKLITFRNFKIAIEEATAEAIVYRVLSDGQ